MLGKLGIFSQNYFHIHMFPLLCTKHSQEIRRKSQTFGGDVNAPLKSNYCIIHFINHFISVLLDMALLSRTRTDLMAGGFEWTGPKM